MIQNVEVELPLGSTEFRMLTSCKLQLATLFLTEEVLSSNMILEWIISGCVKMPLLSPSVVEFTLGDLKELKREAGSLFSTRFDYAKSNPTKEQPVAYEPPHRRSSIDRQPRSVGTQTTAFELFDWIQFQQLRNRCSTSSLE